VLLDGRVCVVSGVGPGMGQAIARAVAREGAPVVLAARTASYLDEVATAIREEGGRATAVPTDVTDPDQCRALIARALDEHGRVDGLVSSAFRPDGFRRFEEVDLDDWRAMFEVNVFGSLQLAQAVLPSMKDQGGGSIVFVNSMIVRKVRPRQGGYAASKAALLTAAQVLAKELGRYRIRVNSVVPGWMWGPPVQAYLDHRSQARGTTVEEAYDEIAREIPLGEIPSQDACADAAVFLLSDLARVVTGQSLDVNGGEVFH